MAEEMPVRLVNNGTVTFTVGGRLIRLRRPRFSEYRQLRERLEEVNDEITARSLDLQRQGVELDAKVRAAMGVGPVDGDDDSDVVMPRVADLPEPVAAEVGALQAESRTLARGFAAAIEDLRLAWFAEAVGVLAVETKLAEEDYEPWMASAAWIDRLMTHWQTTPLALGGG